jgi:twitching motility protein PilT
MAAVDSLVRLITAQNAEALLLASDEVPRLNRAGAVRPLSMPPVGAAMMEVFVGEVLTPEQIQQARGGNSITVERGEFTATVKRQGNGWAMSFKKRPPTRGARSEASRVSEPGHDPGHAAGAEHGRAEHGRAEHSRAEHGRAEHSRAEHSRAGHGRAARASDSSRAAHAEPGRASDGARDSNRAQLASVPPDPGHASVSPARDAALGPAVGPALGQTGTAAPSAVDPGRAPALPVAATSPPRAALPVDARSGGPGRDRLDRWMERALLEQASDLIISARQTARLRVPGGLIEISDSALTDEEILALIDPWLGEAQRAALASHGSTDFAMVRRDPDRGSATRFRVNLFQQGRGLAAVFRPVRRHPPGLDELGLPDVLARLARYPNGLVLVTGPTGSGKSTTIIALVEQLNRELPRHIITLEDPIEYEYRSDRALVHQREVGTHVDSFESGLRAALRESPDLILLGEMRDRATIAAALTAAETGHLVLSTLHAGSAAMAIERVVDVFPEHQQRQIRGQLAGTLRAVVTQHLLPSRSGGARVPAVELMVNNSAVASLIRDGKSHQVATAIQTGRDDGMIPLDRSLADLVESGTVTYDTAAGLTLDGGLQLRDLLGKPSTAGRRPR